MKGAVITIPGFEDVAAQEVEEILGIKAESPAPGIVIFTPKKIADLCLLCYRSQSASTVLLILSQFALAKTPEASGKNLAKSLKGVDLAKWFSKGTTFKVVFGSVGEIDFPSSEFEAELGSAVSEAAEKSANAAPKVDLTSPSLTVLVHAAGSSGFCGAKLTQLELDKREYRIFSHSSDIKGTLAYALLRASGYLPSKQVLFDPFTRSGTIAIEAALFSSGFPVNHYRKEGLSFQRLKPLSELDFEEFFADAEKKGASGKKSPGIIASSSSMPYVRAAEKNAKIAGVNKLIKFSRLDVEWLDAKIEELSIDLVVSYPPQMKSGNDAFAAAENRKTLAAYKEFFYQARFFLAPKGRIFFLLRKPSRDGMAPLAAAQKFTDTVARSLSIGREEFELVKFEKR